MSLKRPYSVSKRPVMQSAVTVSVAAPTKGLNTRDPLSAMDALYGVNLTNVIAAPSGITVREGWRVRNTGLPGYVETVAPYTGTSVGTNKLFAWSGSDIYDVTTPGAVGAAVVTGLSNARWQFVNMSTSGGQFLVCTNGVNPARHWNGSAWVTWTNVASPANPGEILGVNVDTLRHPVVHQRRLWFVEANSSRGWYLPINSVGGTAASLDFGPVFPRGGALAQIASWSLDGGQGVRNFLVAVSVNGDAVIYEGTDPSSASTWTISGTWRLAPPGSDRPLFQFGGDVLYLSVDGLMPLSEYMQDKQTQVALSDTIRPTLSLLTQTQTGLFGWQVHDVLSRNLLVVNVPQINPINNLQFVFNTITRGWSVFNGLPAQCWATLGNQHFFGGFEQVCEAFTGYKDGADSSGVGGSTYTFHTKQAYNYLSDTARARNKRFTLMRVNMIAGNSTPAVRLSANTDFGTEQPGDIGANSLSDAALWDVASWDAGLWAGGATNYNAWQAVAADGYCVSISITGSVLSETEWISTDVVFEPGGIL